MNTDYNLYKIFLYLFEEKSISKTANKLYVSQPAISYSLKELETQLGYPLFYRNSKGIEPTMEAKELYSYVSFAFRILNDAEERIKNLNNLTVGCIRLGVAPYLGGAMVSDFILDFQKEYPGIQFQLVSKTMDEMIEMLDKRELDLIIGCSTSSLSKEIHKFAFSKLDTCFAFLKSSFQDKTIKDISDLNDYSLILPSRNSPLRNKLDEFMKTKNIDFSTSMEVDNFEFLYEMVSKGGGIGYFMKDVLLKENEISSFEILSFDDLPKIDVFLFYRDDFVNTATSKFIDLLKKY